MKSWKQIPQDPLVQKYIECYWFIEKHSDDVYIERPKLNPDASGHLILCTNNQQYGYQLREAEFRGKGTHFILPNSDTIIIDHSRPFSILGVKFNPGAIYSLCFEKKFPLTNFISNQLNPISNLIPPSQTEELLLEAGEADPQLYSKLDKILLPWVKDSREDKHTELVRRAIALFNQKTTSTVVSISDIGNTLGCSQRTIERAFRRVTGFSLKQYEVMIILESLLSHLHKNQQQTIKWADIAAQFGFSDQPHLIRHLKRTIGSTPNSYLKLRDITIDVYGDFE